MLAETWTYGCHAFLDVQGSPFDIRADDEIPLHACQLCVGCPLDACDVYATVAVCMASPNGAIIGKLQELFDTHNCKQHIHDQMHVTHVYQNETGDLISLIK